MLKSLWIFGDKMNNSIKIDYFKPDRPGIKIDHETAYFSFDAGCDYRLHKEFGLILYCDEKQSKIPFNSNFHQGSVFGLSVSGIDFSKTSYNYYVDQTIVHDKYALGFEHIPFGQMRKPEDLKSIFNVKSFDWKDDKNPGIPYEDTVLYGLNVRSFTMHKSSGVKNKGTFEGITEKIKYLKELGVTSLVLMPSYEFDECEAFYKKDKTPVSMEEAKKQAFEVANTEPKINCWGFAEGFYFAPKMAYSASGNCIESFKKMVYDLHRHNIEIIMQFYFSPQADAMIVLDALRYWVSEFHVDGFRICGFNIPTEMLIKDPLLCETKLWFNYINEEVKNFISKYGYRNLAEDNGNFRYDIRKFLKGDEGLLNTYIYYQKQNPSTNAVINCLCDYDGYSLYDLFAYERKHNELNGENNRDGNDFNYSWNCGIEGETRKPAIISLRHKQIKNAIMLLFLSQGTPYIFSGDEFGNTRMGNNNAYCQDNEIGYIKWKKTKFHTEILDFTKNIIKLRKENSILHWKTMLTNTDVIGVGYPDLSYHGIEAWRADLSYNSRMLGMFLYGPSTGCNEADSFYIGINMHWEKHRLAVPKLRRGYSYKKIVDTSMTEGKSKDNEIPVADRTVVVYKVIRDMENK